MQPLSLHPSTTRRPLAADFYLERSPRALFSSKSIAYAGTCCRFFFFLRSYCTNEEHQIVFDAWSLSVFTIHESHSSN